MVVKKTNPKQLIASILGQLPDIQTECGVDANTLFTEEGLFKEVPLTCPSCVDEFPEDETDLQFRFGDSTFSCGVCGNEYSKEEILLGAVGQVFKMARKFQPVLEFLAKISSWEEDIELTLDAETEE